MKTRSSLLANQIKVDRTEDFFKLLIPLYTCRQPKFDLAVQPKNILIVGNREEDGPEFPRIKAFSQQFSRETTNVFLLPYLASAHLSNDDQDSFAAWIAECFAMLVSIGGADVDPKLYGEANRHSKNTNYLRDRLELELIRIYKKSEKGFFVGICRGHQLGALADGHGLFQDVAIEAGGEVHLHLHFEGEVADELQAFHRVDFSSSLLDRFEDFTRTQVVNSVHHQCVKPNDHAASRPIAFSEDGIVEALEMKNGKGISFQFHPEICALKAKSNTSGFCHREHFQKVRNRFFEWVLALAGVA